MCKSCPAAELADWLIWVTRLDVVDGREDAAVSQDIMEGLAASGIGDTYCVGKG